MTITTELSVCTFNDPAIDMQHSDLLEYTKTRDVSHLKFHEGMEPVFFTVKRITTDMLLRLKEFGKGDRATYRYLCFLTACTEYKIGEVKHEAKLIQNTTVAEDKWIDELRIEFGMDVVEELVDVAYKFQTLSKRNPLFV